MILLDLYHASRDAPYVSARDLEDADGAPLLRGAVTVDEAARFLSERMDDRFPLEVVRDELQGWLDTQYPSSLWLFADGRNAARVLVHKQCRHCGKTHLSAPGDLCVPAREDFEAAAWIESLMAESERS